MKGKLQTLFGKLVNRETVYYAIFGVLTSILNVALFQLLISAGTDYRISNIFALAVTKLAAYLLNKNFVFLSHCENFRELCLEFGRFVLARGATMLLDYFGLILLVESFGVNRTVGKLGMTALVVILNYILGKAAVFRNRKGETLWKKSV